MFSCRAMKAVVDPGMVRSSRYMKLDCRQMCQGFRQLAGFNPSSDSLAQTMHSPCLGYNLSRSLSQLYAVMHLSTLPG